MFAPEDEPTVERPTSVKPIAEVMEDYDTNAIAFERNWYGRRITVVGEVDTIRERIMEEGYAVKLYDLDSFNSMDCNLESGQLDRVMRLEKGDVVWANGIIDSGLLGPDLYDCTIRSGY